MKECFRKSEKRLVPQKNQHLRESATLLTLRQTLYFRLLKHALRNLGYCLFKITISGVSFHITCPVSDAFQVFDGHPSTGVCSFPERSSWHSYGSGGKLVIVFPIS